MGLISLPTMLNNKYDKSLASGIVCSSGTLGQIIPPSIVLIIIADQLASAADVANTMRQSDYKIVTGEFNMPGEFRVGSTSAGDMFLGALLPGLVLVGLYMLYVLVYARLNPKAAPPVPFRGNFDTKFWTRVFMAAFGTTFLKRSKILGLDCVPHLLGSPPKPCCISDQEAVSLESTPPSLADLLLPLT